MPTAVAQWPADDRPGIEHGILRIPDAQLGIEGLVLCTIGDRAATYTLKIVSPSISSTRKITTKT